jgi:hypothetical protein
MTKLRQYQVECLKQLRALLGAHPKSGQFILVRVATGMTAPEVMVKGTVISEGSDHTK